jgi:hypothetical protein
VSDRGTANHKGRCLRAQRPMMLLFGLQICALYMKKTASAGEAVVVSEMRGRLGGGLGAELVECAD